VPRVHEGKGKGIRVNLVRYHYFALHILLLLSGPDACLLKC
jgi:hypothetical protein